MLITFSRATSERLKPARAALTLTAAETPEWRGGGGSVQGEVDVMTLATEASRLLVAEVVRSGWQGLRGAVVRFFRRDGSQSLERQMALFDQVHEQLEAADPDERERVRQMVHERWLRQLPAYLERYPEAVEELRELVASLPGAEAVPDGGTTMNANFNTESVVVQSRGDVNAGGGINYGVKPRTS